MSQIAISLPEDLQSFVTEAVRSGRYSDEGEFVVNALYKAMEEEEQASYDEASLDPEDRQKLHLLRSDIRAGLEPLNRGEGISNFDWDAFVHEMHQERSEAKSD
jgi:Arc/MetJ-type ribon-helix-helix transcriptional regulator